MVHEDEIRGKSEAGKCYTDEFKHSEHTKTWDIMLDLTTSGESTATNAFLKHWPPGALKSLTNLDVKDTCCNKN